MSGLTLDAGALIQAERGDERTWKVLNAMVRGGRGRVTVPAPALAQVWRGGGRANLTRALHGCELEPFTPEMAKRVGKLCSLTHTSDVVDAAVMVSAATRGDAVLTTDVDDLAVLAQVLPTVRLIRV